MDYKNLNSHSYPFWTLLACSIKFCLLNCLYSFLEVIRPLKTEALLSITNNNYCFDKLMCNLFVICCYKI